MNPIEIDQRIIDTTTEYLAKHGLTEGEIAWSFLKQKDEALGINNKLELEGALREYDTLISNFNSYKLSDLEGEVTNKACQLKVTLNGTPLPRLGDMMKENYYVALIKSTKLMKMAMDIKKGELEKTADNSLVAIGTPLYPAPLMPKIIGTAAHLMERTFFQWADKQGIYPLSGEWVKDDWLHPMKEVLLLDIYNHYTKEKNSKLIPVFLELGWLTRAKMEEFNRNY